MSDDPNDFEEIREEAKTYSADEIRSGAWFARLIRYVLENYAKKVDAAYFRNKYPGLPADAVIDRRIDIAKKAATLAGGANASAVSVAMIATMGTGGGASPATVPIAVASMTGDLLYTTSLQLKLTYDLSVLYGHPIDFDDPEDLFDLVRVAFGIKAGEVMSNAVSKIAPEAARQGAKFIFSGARLAWLRALPVVGRWLLQRNLLKVSVPLVSIPIAGAMGWWGTKSIARHARQVFRDKAAIRTHAAQAAEADRHADALVLLKSAWLMVAADRNTAAEEAWYLAELTDAMTQAGGEVASAVREFSEMITFDADAVLAEVRDLPQDYKAHLFEVLTEIAVVDHQLHAAEWELLSRFAEATEQKLDRRQIEKRIKDRQVSA